MPAPPLGDLIADLAAEQDDLDGRVAPLAPKKWSAPTPAPGWDVRDQIGHLAYFDARAVEAVVEPEAFTAGAAALVEDPHAMDRVVGESRTVPVPELLTRWRIGRQVLLHTFRAADPRARVPWYGVSMAVASLTTARLMEAWAHGQDVVDALNIQRAPTARLRHVAHLGVRTMAFSFQSHGLAVPDASVCVELAAPGGTGERWAWGDEAATDHVSGSALDFCLVVTQRRHVADTDLEVTGHVASRWLSIAQAFAGPPGAGRQPGQFRER